MTKADELREALTRSRDRARYCEKELHRFGKTADLTDEATVRTHRKLEADWRRACNDVAVLENVFALEVASPAAPHQGPGMVQ